MALLLQRFGRHFLSVRSANPLLANSSRQLLDGKRHCSAGAGRDGKGGPPDDREATGGIPSKDNSDVSPDKEEKVQGETKNTKRKPKKTKSKAFSEEVKHATDEQREETKRKLNDLLGSINTMQPPSGAGNKPSVGDLLARPGGKPRPRNVVPRPAPSPGAEPAPQTTPDSQQPTLDEQVAEAARQVAVSLAGGDAERSASTEAELLRKLSGDYPEGPSPDKLNLNELMAGMTLERRAVRKPRGKMERGDTLSGDSPSADKPRQPRRMQTSNAGAWNLNSGESLGIFTAMSEAAAPAGDELVAGGSGVWERVDAQELELAVTQPPANAWEEMIQWTEEGTLWQLPVDNEQGLEEEAAVGFHEHVFLEGHLEPWCPPRGPIRHFMELVCVGLGKNPWLTVEEKKQHIEWFREYFAGKQELLQELKAVG